MVHPLGWSHVLTVLTGCVAGLLISFWPSGRGAKAVYASQVFLTNFLGLTQSIVLAVLVPVMLRRMRRAPTSVCVSICVAQLLQGYTTNQLLCLHRHTTHGGLFESVCELCLIASLVVTCFYYTTSVVEVFTCASTHSAGEGQSAGIVDGTKGTPPTRRSTRRIQPPSIAPLRGGERAPTPKVKAS